MLQKTIQHCLGTGVRERLIPTAKRQIGGQDRIEGSAKRQQAELTRPSRLFRENALGPLTHAFENGPIVR